MRNSDKCPRSASFNSIFGISDLKKEEKNGREKKEVCTTTESDLRGSMGVNILRLFTSPLRIRSK